ncbi:ABC transporter permease [Allobranchiibius sp. GilTou73]|uniref:ABC transporter permease n=1 Tax=Allobranchiibius sp. GilTou73 TaxID=2904523 RepID=UPI001F3CB773|nr:ABC transporter permease [Allobranchiibius sp. GilTou73]UIJ34268.1 ABC transporter permease [Allobranchiibius sp. GilTou73]
MTLQTLQGLPHLVLGTPGTYVGEYGRLALGLILLLSIACVVLRQAAIPHVRGVVTASARAVVQLALIALALRGVFAAPITVIAVIAVMFTVACWTAGRRLRGQLNAMRAVVASIGAGVSVAVAIIVGMPTLTRDVRTLVAVCGIVIGGAMTVATLTGRRFARGLHDRRDEVEAWLSIGATPRQAARDVARTSVYEALVPALDQTRTVGLVTLPGAFVGALLGGASAESAARFQIVVLVGLLCAQSITATLLAWLIGAPQVLPAAPHD